MLTQVNNLSFGFDAVHDAFFTKSEEGVSFFNSGKKLFYFLLSKGHALSREEVTELKKAAKNKSGGTCRICGRNAGLGKLTCEECAQSAALAASSM